MSVRAWHAARAATLTRARTPRARRARARARPPGLKPNCVLLVATVRALKMHGDGPKVVAGKAIPKEYTEENLPLVGKVCGPRPLPLRARRAPRGSTATRVRRPRARASGASVQAWSCLDVPAAAVTTPSPAEPRESVPLAATAGSLARRGVRWALALARAHSRAAALCAPVDAAPSARVCGCCAARSLAPSARRPLPQGVTNMQKHIKNAHKFGVPVVVCVNRFATDTDAEIELVRGAALSAGADAAVIGEHHAKGGAGAVTVAEAVKAACAKSRALEAKGQGGFKYLYELDLPIKSKIETIAMDVRARARVRELRAACASRPAGRRGRREAGRGAARASPAHTPDPPPRTHARARRGAQIYGADGVTYSREAEEKIKLYTEMGFDALPICMAKTQYSLTAEADKKGVPTGFTLPIQDVRVSVGAGFIYPLCGTMSTMPGLPTRPAFYDVDVDPKTGRVQGLF